MLRDDLERLGRAFEGDLRRLQSELAEVFTGLGGPLRTRSIPVNVWTDDEGAVVAAELGGVRMEEVEVSVLGDEVILAGSYPEDGLDDASHYVVRERPSGKFRRGVRLPFRIDAGGVVATLTNGMLRVRLPREDKERPHRVRVEPG